MESFCSFRLPNFWKSAGNTPASVTSPKSSPPPKIENLLTDDDGPFFDLEFIIAKEISGEENDSEDEDNDSHDKKLNFKEVPSEEKNSSNFAELVQKYLRKMKHLQVRVLKNRAEEAMEKTGEKREQLAMPEKLRIVCERLGKCKSFSSIEATVSSPRRRDDSLQMRQDGIQSAIVHCKRSLNEFAEDIEE